MATKQFFNVQTFEIDKRKKKLVPGRLHQMKSEAEAARKGESQAGRPGVAGVLVFELVGDPEMDNWDEPRLIASHGQVPAEATA